MQNNYLNKQIDIARNNYNYFFMQMITKIFIVLLRLSIILLISGVFNYTIINIIAIVYTIISIYRIVFITSNYKYIIEDIKDTLGFKDLSFEIDLNFIRNNIFRGMLNYGK